MNEIFFLISLTALYGIACYPRSNRYCWACVITYPVLGLLLGLLIANVIGAFDPILIQNFLPDYISIIFTLTFYILVVILYIYGINNKEFLLACEDGQEEHLEELLIQINNKFNNLKNDLGNLGENKLLLITAVKIMDEYYETKKKVDQKKDELNDLSNKFKELKSLIYDYRDTKESEIEKLNLDHENLKQEIEDNQKKYENLIDEAADQISNFVKKAKLENISK